MHHEAPGWDAAPAPTARLDPPAGEASRPNPAPPNPAPPNPAPPNPKRSQPPRDSRDASRLPHQRRLRGALAVQVMARLGLPRWCADVLQWTLLVGVAAWGWPHGERPVIFFAVLGGLAGFVLYRVRPGARWARVLVVAGIPVAFVGLLCWGIAHNPYWMTPIVLLPAVDIGVRVAELRERATGIRRSVLARDWAGVDAVGEPGGVQFDVRPLTARVTRAELREFRRTAPRVREFGVVARLAYVTVVVVVMPIGFLAMFFGMAQEVGEQHDDMVGELIAMSAILSLMVVAWIVLIWWSGAMRGRITPLADHLRFARFAAQNGFEYRPGPARGHGTDTLTRVMRTRAGERRISIANREGPRRGEGASAAQRREMGVETTHFGGICEVELTTEMPHIWLHSTGHRAPAFAALTAPARSQRLSLEGDFDRWYELYCPEGYERDALYLFTPDVMAWLVDDVRGFDVELVDRRLVLRSRSTLVTRDPEDWAYLARALQALRARIAQWERWRDDRVDPAAAQLRIATSGPRPSGTVGTGGRRLRRGIGAGAILTGLCAALYLLLTLLGNTL